MTASMKVALVLEGEHPNGGVVRLLLLRAPAKSGCSGAAISCKIEEGKWLRGLCTARRREGTPNGRRGLTELVGINDERRRNPATPMSDFGGVAARI